MKWYEIRIHTTGAASEAVSDWVLELGAGGCEVVEPDLLPDGVEGSLKDLKLPADASGKILIKCWFSEQVNLEDLSSRIQEGLGRIARFLPVGSRQIDTSLVDEESWADSWKKYYKPFQLSSRLFVCPSWEEAPQVPKDARQIILDPGMAFGSGTHETTALCAAFIDRYVRPGDRFIDAGCGSGILSIAAVLLGASKAIAFDIDPVAARTAADNCAMNGVAGQVTVLTGDAGVLPDEQVELLAANIVADVILSMFPVFSHHMAPRGRLILSGILWERRDEIIRAGTGHGFQLADEQRRGDWVALVMTCQDSL